MLPRLAVRALRLTYDATLIAVTAPVIAAGIVVFATFGVIGSAIERLERALS